jgi:ATP-dependent DNA ligase
MSDGEGIRAEPLEERKRRLAGLLRLPDDGTILKHACALGCEGIASKRRWSPYRAGPLSGVAQDQEPCRARAFDKAGCLFLS